MPEWADEASLLRAIAHGDQGAAQALVQQTYAKAFGLLAHLTGDRELAADLTQETYRRAWAALAGFDGRARLSTWLYRIAYNVFLNHVRSVRRLVPLDEDFAACLPDGHPGADDELEAGERRERLRRAVLALPEELRGVVVARYWADAPVAEIAGLEGISEVAIRKRLRRAFERLGRALQEVTP